MADKYVPRMQQMYADKIVKAMTDKFGYKNALEVPKIEKIVLNMGVGEATQDKKKVEQAASEMELIAGQKPVVTKAKKSIAQSRATSALASATYAFPGPTILSTRGTLAVPYAIAAIAWAPPTWNTRSTPASMAAARTDASGRGHATITSRTPAARAVTAAIRSDEGSGERPPGT